MTEIAMGNLLAIFSMVMILVSYVITSITLFKISAKEKVCKPFFAWIPILNDFLLIKLGQGSIWFIMLALVSLFLGGPMTSYFNSSTLVMVGTIVTALWTLYKILLYNRICERYDGNIIILGIGFILELIPKMSLAGLIIAIIGQILLMKKVKSNFNPKTIIESKIVISKRNKK
ncbi:MAG: hypothetical protein K5986_08855 [Clostridium sp.]|uniref:hypothetical protein n=1 Tax=Clostridium sp. DSM 8431 TaxID=1761781 RepID=UPI0008E1AFA1|nr:hypothetical protein [Clostridium sp. DSM 8431]MCR4944538.1 hypothetical protein [Clostridium sp.]SFU55304.1 hypothetical protein SAMN04487886_10558 [Clostridium sp. DSM 8431]